MIKAACLALAAAVLAVPVRAQNNCMMDKLQELCGPMTSPSFKACSKEKSKDAAMECQGQKKQAAYDKTAKELKSKSPCMEDSKKYCAGLYPGTPEYSACMSKNESKLTPECKAFAKTRSHQGPAKLGECGADAEKLCPHDGPGSPKFMSCMMGHYDELSPACQAKFKNVHKRG